MGDFSLWYALAKPLIASGAPCLTVICRRQVGERRSDFLKIREFRSICRSAELDVTGTVYTSTSV
jgi:hypothetical protein